MPFFTVLAEEVGVFGIKIKIKIELQILNLRLKVEQLLL